MPIPTYDKLLDPLLELATAQARPSATVLTNEYLLMVLLYVLAPTRISRLMVGSTAQHLNVRELKSLKVPIPPLARQTAFSERVCVVRRAMESSFQAASQLRSLFTVLQHRAFAGEL
jgi:type I restriction enzyme, S subunit